MSDRWEIWIRGEQSEFTGSRKDVVKFFQEKFPDKNVEAFTDQVLVYDPDRDYANEIDVDPIASATPL